jgi:hypothetical protein
VLDDFSTTMPAAKPDYVSGRQAHDDMPLDRFTTIQNVIVAASLAVLFATAVTNWMRGRVRLFALSFIIVAMVLANAFVTGAMSMVDPRFESRVIWLVPFLAGQFLLDWVGQRRAAAALR